MARLLDWLFCFIEVRPSARGRHDDADVSKALVRLHDPARRWLLCEEGLDAGEFRVDLQAAQELLTEGENRQREGGETRPGKVAQVVERIKVPANKVAEAVGKAGRGGAGE